MDTKYKAYSLAQETCQMGDDVESEWTSTYVARQEGWFDVLEVSYGVLIKGDEDDGEEPIIDILACEHSFKVPVDSEGEPDWGEIIDGDERYEYNYPFDRVLNTVEEAEKVARSYAREDESWKLN